MSVLFWDGVCPRPYSIDTLRHEALGGTEATALRVTQALGARLYQHNAGHTLPMFEEHVVVLREPTHLEEVQGIYPEAKLYLWLHDLAGPQLAAHRDLIAKLKPTIICVSDFHRAQARDVLGYIEGVSVRRIYNPIDDSLGPEGEYDTNKLVFFSSPHKGLERTLRVFLELHSEVPEMQLFLANPGYLTATIPKLPGVTNLGALPHHEILGHVRGALCTFFLNAVFPETFGLVLAESNAVGTPCLTANIGAAREVLSHPLELIDVSNARAVIERIKSWRSGNRPKVRANADFRLSNVIPQWQRLFT